MKLGTWNLRQSAAWVAIGVLVALQLVSPWPYLTPDAVAYLSMARSLAHEGTLLRFSDPHVRFGPAYPFVISPVFWFADEPFLLITLLNLGLLALFAFAIFRWARAVAPETAPYASAFAVVNVVVLAMFRRPLSETVFCPLLFAISVGYNRALIGTLRPRWWAVLIPGACVLVLTRQAGVMLPVGFACAVFWQAIRGRRSWGSAIGLAAIATVPPVAAVVGWAAFDGAKAHREGDFHHVSALRTDRGPEAADLPTGPLPRRVLEGLRVRIAEVGRVTLPLMSKVYAPSETWLHQCTLFYVPWFALVLCGWLRHLRETDDAMAWMWPWYFALYVYWPFDQAARFTAPLAPLLFVFTWRAVGNLRGWRPTVFTAMIVMHLLISLGTWIVTDRPRGYGLWKHQPELHRIAEEFRARPHELAVDADAPEIARLLEFWLDQPIPAVTATEPSPRWVVGWESEQKRIPLQSRTVLLRAPTP